MKTHNQQLAQVIQSLEERNLDIQLGSAQDLLDEVRE